MQAAAAALERAQDPPIADKTLNREASAISRFLASSHAGGVDKEEAAPQAQSVSIRASRRNAKGMH